MVTIEAMKSADYDEAMNLWKATPGLGVSAGFDTPERVAAYLARNPGLSMVARDEGRLVGTVLCGHDGRRGSLYHMIVSPEHRGHGLARQMVERCLDGLRAEGIRSAFLFVHAGNQAAAAFWAGIGWQVVPNVQYYYREF